jgi:myo-inositol-1-phosphate synthase
MPKAKKKSKPKRKRPSSREVPATEEKEVVTSDKSAEAAAAPQTEPSALSKLVSVLKPDIRLAIIGVGNVASCFVQAIYSKKLDGVWHEKIGGYKTSDIKIVAAFDIDKRKVGRDLAEAIFSEPNVTPKFSDVPKTGIKVQPGIVNYEVPKYLADKLVGADNFADLLKLTRANIVLNLIPSGMPDTSFDYAEAALKAGCSFINATPVPVANNDTLRNRFVESKVVIVGDDLLSQFGGTAFHKGILDFMNSRGLKIEKSYQLDVGGGTETLNTINESVKMEKREIKTESIAEELPYKFETVAGTTDYVDYMGNNRTSYFWIQAKSFFNSSVKIDVYLRTNDAANAGNVLFDVVRAVAKAKQEGRYGSPKEICDYGFKKLRKPALLRKAHEEFLDRYS